MDGKEPSSMDCKERMETYLRENGVTFEVKRHSTAYTMPEVAAALHEPGKHVAKVVMVKAGDHMAMLVVPSPYRLNMDQVGDLLGVQKVRLAHEHEFGDLFPDCAPGAMPPFGNLYDVPVYVDRSLADQEGVVFRIGTHQHTMKVAYADFARLAQPIVGEFAYLA
jgi:Ala-tRNA(Pro) deacylase